MRDTPPTLTYFSTAFTRNGNPQRVSVSLPYIASIADDPHYAAPPPVARARAAGHRAPAALVGKTHPPHARTRPQAKARLLNRVGYEAAMRRIDRGGV